MHNAESALRKPRVVRIVTAPYVVPWHLGNTLKRMPADFDVYVVGQDVSIHRDVYPGVNWVDLDLGRKISLWADILALIKLCWILCRLRPAIMHSIMPKAGLLSAIAGFLCRVPVRMHTFTGQVWATRTGLGRFFYYFIDRLVHALNTVCMTDSPSQSAFLFDNGFSFNGNPLPYLVYGSLSGVDIERFCASPTVRAKVREELNIPVDSFVFLFLGRMNRDKGILELVQAFAAVDVPHFHLVLVGPDEEDIGNSLRERPLFCADRIHFVGFASKPENYMRAADVFCIPSHREGFGSVVIEAAATGLPTIGTRIPGLVDAVEDGRSGVLVPLGDINALSDAMRYFGQNPEIASVMGAHARCRVVECFSADVLYEALRDYYLQLGHFQNRSTLSTR